VVGVVVWVRQVEGLRSRGRAGAGADGVGSPSSWLMWVKSRSPLRALARWVSPVALTERGRLCVVFGSRPIGRVAFCRTVLSAPREPVGRFDRDSEGWLLRSNSVVAPKGKEGWRSARKRRGSSRRFGKPQGRLWIPLEQR
jgi:hypothetical protein